MREDAEGCLNIDRLFARRKGGRGEKVEKEGKDGEIYSAEDAGRQNAIFKSRPNAGQRDATIHCTCSFGHISGSKNPMTTIRRLDIS